MPWDLPGSYRVMIGGNYFQDCGELITYDGEPLFNLRRRESDRRLGIDFDVYDAARRKIATIRNGNVVDGDTEAFTIDRGPDCHTIRSKATGEVVCQVDRRPYEAGVELAVTVNMFLPNGFLLRATPDQMNLGGTQMIGNTMRNCRVGIAIGRNPGGAGIALRAPD